MKDDAVGYAHASDISEAAIARAADSVGAVKRGYSGHVASAPQRSNIKLMKSLDRSLMPVGLESAVNQEQMADLLAFLLGR